MSDGSRFDIRHPEVAVVTRTVIVVTLYNGTETDMPEYAVLCDPLHITRLEPIRAQAVPRSGG